MCEVIIIKKEVIKWINEMRPASMAPLNEDANVGAILGFILAAIVMMIGVVILSQINQATFGAAFANSTSGGTLRYTNAMGWNTTFETLVPQMTGGYSLMMVVVIVIAASVILGILMTSFVGRREQ